MDNEKEYVLLLQEELEINIKILEDYINYAKANNLEKIDTRKKETIKFKVDNWEKYKKDILLINNGFYANEIKNIYKMFFMIDNTNGYVTIEAPIDTLEGVNNLISKLKKYLFNVE